MVDFAKTRAEVMQKWHAITEDLVPLGLAAEFALHGAHPELNVLVPQEHYEDALNLAAAALSRITPIFAIQESTSNAIPVNLSLVLGRFRCAATMYESVDGKRLASLVIPREEVPGAVSLIARAGLPFRFTMANRR